MRAMSVLALAGSLAACRQGADAFFSGRPSEMSQVHNRIIGGPPEAVLALLRVPARFPDAEPAHIVDWQRSVVAWWAHSDKRATMLKLCAGMPASEQQALHAWVGVRDAQLQSAREAQVLDQAAAMVQEACPPTQRR